MLGRRRGTLTSHQFNVSDTADVIDVQSIRCATVTTHSTSTRPPFDSHSTAIRPGYHHSTTYVTTVGSGVDHGELGGGGFDSPENM